MTKQTIPVMERIQFVIGMVASLTVLVSSVGLLVYMLFFMNSNPAVDHCVERGKDRFPQGKTLAIRHVCEKNPNHY